MKTIAHTKYSVNLQQDKETVVKNIVNEWVMRWVKREHPEIFEIAEKEVRDRLEDTEENT